MAIELAEGALSVFGAIVRVIFVEFFLEIAIKLPGLWILRAAGRNPDPDGWRVILTGLLFWAAIGAVIALIIR